MTSTHTLKIAFVVVGILGVITAGVCIWLVADPLTENIAGIKVKFADPNSSKIGLATGILMTFLSIIACVVDLDKYKNHLAVGVFLVLILAIATFALAIKEHQDVESIKNIGKLVDHVSSQGGFGDSFGGQGGGFNVRTRQMSRTTIQSPISNKSWEKLQVRLKVVAAAGGIDSIMLVIALIIFFLILPIRTDGLSSVKTNYTDAKLYVSNLLWQKKTLYEYRRPPSDEKQLLYTACIYNQTPVLKCHIIK